MFLDAQFVTPTSSSYSATTHDAQSAHATSTANTRVMDVCCGGLKTSVYGASCLYSKETGERASLAQHDLRQILSLAAPGAMQRRAADLNGCGQVPSTHRRRHPALTAWAQYPASPQL